MTTTVEIQYEEYTAVATAGEGPGIFSVATTGGVVYRIGSSKPAASDPGHFVAEKETIELAKALSSGKSLWVKGANTWDGLIVKTLDSEV